MTIRRFKEDPNHDVHINIVRAYAAALGVNFLWLAEGTGPRDLGADEASRPVLSSLPGWPTALAEAKRRERFFPAFAWVDAGVTSPLVAPAHVDADMVIAAARLAMSLRNDDELEVAEASRIDDEERDREARQVEGEKRVREAAARGEKLSLSKAMKQLRDEAKR